MSARGVLGNAYLIFAPKEMQSSACAAGKIVGVSRGCVWRVWCLRKNHMGGFRSVTQYCALILLKSEVLRKRE